MSHWRGKIYLRLSPGGEDAARYFNIPTERVFEIGDQVKF